MYTNAHRLPAIWFALVVIYSAGTYAAEPGLVDQYVYGILDEAAGHKADKNDARKDQMRALIARVGGNTVAAKDDIRCNVLKSLMPHVAAVLGADEAAKYDRVAVVPPE